MKVYIKIYVSEARKSFNIYASTEHKLQHNIAIKYKYILADKSNQTGIQFF